SPLTGWEIDAPESDTALRQFLLAQGELQRLLGVSLEATIVENERLIAVDTGRPASMVNMGLIRQPLHAANIEQTMAELDGLFGREDARGFVAVYCPLPTPDLSGWGWSLAGHPPLQLRSPFAPLVPSDVRVERVENKGELAEFEQIMIEGFDFEEMRGAEAGTYMSPEILQDERFGAWIGYLDGDPVAAAASFVEAGIVDVVMVATVPAERRRGAGLAVTQAAARPELGLP